jgi:hypothetical protein
MGGLDRVFAWVDGLWLRFNDLEHDIRADVPLEEELSASDLRAMDAVLKELDTALEEYDPCIYEVSLLEDESKTVGRYNGRDGARPQIELDPSGRPVPPLWAHEVGHDVAASLDLLPERDRIVRKTFDETVAYLAAHEMHDRLGQGRQSWLGPFRYTHRHEWERLRKVDDPDRYDTLDEVLDAADRRDWNGMANAADGFALVSPDGNQRSDRSSMVATYFGDPKEQDLEVVTALWRDMEYVSDPDAAEILELVADEDGAVQDRLASRIRWADDLEDVYDEVMREELEETVADLRQNWREPGEAEDIIDAFAHETYGYTGVENDGYDDHLDLPHSVGGALAKELYDAGVGLEELAEEPELYHEKAEEALEYTVEHALDGGGAMSYDLSGLV